MDERTQKMEEALSAIWEEREKGVKAGEEVCGRVHESIPKDVMSDLVKEGYVSAEEKPALTPKGESRARDVIRRQRLAERLLSDVLELGRGEMVTSACEMEHIISREVEESICTLLGHPRECPHGLSIPPGNCCTKDKEQINSIVMPLSRLKAGENARVVYVLTRQHPQLHKLMSFGIMPGTVIKVHQTFPSFVVQVGETQIALEKDIADEIHVKRSYE
jgi:DtxR family transcriptional regulator, Mn-dependent transcriptional regulator